ncbi:MAG TPA: alcohol dehydrogenase catalytic domain-containing protein, partial [Polyangia bacterium]
SIPRYALAKALGKQIPSLYWGPLSCLSLREVPEPALRGPAWAKIAVEAAGFCGSDLSTVLLKMSPALTPFSSFPAVLGHEIFGRLVEVGGEARAAGFREGDRVAVNPAFGCRVRGIDPPCPACATGHPATCHRAGESAGGLAPGFTIGYHRDLPGGFSERVVAHVTQLHRVPDGVPDARAVLTEPLSIGLHAVLHRPPRDDEHVLVIGGGMIAYSVLAALRLAGHKCRVTQLVLVPFQAELARALGADDVIVASEENAFERVIALTGARRWKPIIGGDVLTGGFAVSFDCVGTRDSLRDALAYTQSQGTIVMVGACGIVPKIDLTNIWAKELDIRGTYFYAPEANGRHTIDMATELLTGDGARAVDALVTHTFPLEKYQEAIVANIDRGKSKAMKTIFKPAARS